MAPPIQRAEWKRCEDVRLRGFSTRASLEEATAWLDAHGERLAVEEVAASEAVGRVIAGPIRADVSYPTAPRAAEDGYALRSRETIGAGTYNPLRFALQSAGVALRDEAAALVAAGTALPAGADTVLPFSAAQVEGAWLEVTGAVAQGTGVEPEGHEVRAGAEPIASSRLVRPEDAALLAALHLEHVSAVRRPRVRLVIAGPKGAGCASSADADGPALERLVARDGGLVEDVVRGASDRSALAAAVARPGADAILVAGRTGTGPDDDAPLALADVGELDVHGVALRPGGSAGLGLVGNIPVVLLPGAPLSCQCAYELLAGRLVRRLGGREPGLPHAVEQAEVGSKIVSVVGFTDVCWVCLERGRAELIASADDAGLGAAARADGFVLVPAPLEGYAPGSRVAVHRYH